MKVTITGYVQDVTNAGVKSAVLRFKLNKSGYFDNTLYLDGTYAEAFTDASGRFSVSLWANTESREPTSYKLEVITDREHFIEHDLYIPTNKASYTIGEIIDFSRSYLKTTPVEIKSIQDIIKSISPPDEYIWNVSNTGFVTYPAVLSLLASGLQHGNYVYLTAYYAGGVGGGGLLRWDANSTLPVDGGSILKATDRATGRFIRVAHTQGIFTPEDFGAKGDDSFNDYPAFMALAARVTAYGGGLINFRKNAKYFYNEYIDYNRTDGGPVDAWKDIPIFRGFNGLTIEGNGATIRVKGDFYRPKDYQYTTEPYGRKGYFSNVDACSHLTFAYGNNLTVNNLYLLGGATQTTRYEVPPTGYDADGYPMGGEYIVEAYSIGMNIWSTDNIKLTNVHASHCQTDGFIFMYSEVYGPDGVTRVTNADRKICHNIVMENCTSYHNRRQAISIVGARNFTAINCDFSKTGIVGINSDGTYQFDAYGWHTPGLGVDIEPSLPVVNTDNPNAQVLEFTGSIHFINCRIVDNVNGPISCIYSDKIDSNVKFDNCLIDFERATTPDSWLYSIIGTTFTDCEFKLNKLGFLWMQSTPEAKRVISNVSSVIRGGKIKIKATLGHRNASMNVPVTIDGVEITLPASAYDEYSLPIYFFDRIGATYNQGKNKNVRFTNNTILIPYTYGIADEFGPAIAILEGVGHVGGNTWLMTGQRPSTLPTDFYWTILYSSDLGAGQRAFITKPYSERYYSSGTNKDILIVTPDGNKIVNDYTYLETQKKLVKTTIPFGLYGPAPTGKTTVTYARWNGMGTITGINAGFENNLATGLTAKVNVYYGGSLMASGTITEGKLSVQSTTGFPFIPYETSDNLALRIELEMIGTGTLPTDFSGFLTVETLQ